MRKQEHAAQPPKLHSLDFVTVPSKLPSFLSRSIALEGNKWPLFFREKGHEFVWPDGDASCATCVQLFSFELDGSNFYKRTSFFSLDCHIGFFFFSFLASQSVRAAQFEDVRGNCAPWRMLLYWPNAQMQLFLPRPKDRPIPSFLAPRPFYLFNARSFFSVFAAAYQRCVKGFNGRNVLSFSFSSRVFAP